MDAIEYLIADFWERRLPELTSRDIVLPRIPNKANVAVGMRRSGKTYLLYQEMHRLLDDGISKRDLLYLNLEDDRLDPTAPGLLDRVLETYFRMHPTARERLNYIFFDEIQMVPGWERFVRRVLDTENARVFLSGSSAKMLSTEVATELRGRGISTEVLPFSFRESVRHAGVSLQTGESPGAALRSRLSAHVRHYLDVGGFPEVQDIEEPDRIRILQDYVELVLLRDIVERHSVENVHAAKLFTLRLLQSSSRMFSVNSLYKGFRSQGVSTSKDTLHALLDHLSDALLVFPVEVFRRSLKARRVNQRKIYAIDPGLMRAMSFVTAVDTGARLENLVYLELRRRIGRAYDGAISYYTTASGKEVDFVLGDPDEGVAQHLIQVCATLGKIDTREREVRALIEAMEELDLQDSTIVTLDEEEVIETDPGRISILPAWEWAIQGLRQSGA